MLAVKTESEESRLFYLLRSTYYTLVSGSPILSITPHSTGFGLYDKTVIDVCRKLDDPYPYFRGLISEIGFRKREGAVPQPSRKRGLTKNNFYTLYDLAMLGLTITFARSRCASRRCSASRCRF